MNTIDYNLLERKFSFFLASRPNGLFSMNAAELLKEENMDQLLHIYMPTIKAAAPDVAGTYFCSWFRSVCLVHQYAVSVCDAAMDLSLSNLDIQLYSRDGRCVFACVYRHPRQNMAPAGLRESWREEAFASFYGDQVRPLFESVSRSSGVNIGQLWGQLPSGFPSAIELFLQEANGDDGLRLRIEDDYRYLTGQLDGEGVCGRKRNPFDVKLRLVDNPYDPEKPYYMKTSCCLFHHTEGGYYCYTCPRLTAEEREERKAAMLAEAKRQAAAGSR